MKSFDKELLARIESLLVSYRQFLKDRDPEGRDEALVYGLRCLVNLAQMVLRGESIFGIEPWHAIAVNARYQQVGELLLRLRDHDGQPLPPYPFIMAFYDNGFTAQLDCILVSCALRRFVKDPDARQVAINISARSLRHPDFVRVILGRLEKLNLGAYAEAKIIFEIHESGAHLSMSRQVLDLFRQVGCAFAIDDVGLSINDIMRLGEFEGIADYIKLDRHCVCADPFAPNSLGQAVAFIQDMLPEAIMVAEGVKSAEHARQIQADFPGIAYVQGLYLPSKHAVFKDEFQNACDLAFDAFSTRKQASA